MIEYTLVRTARKSMELRVLPDGTAVVRAPLELPKETIDAFVRSHEKRIRLEQEKARRANSQPPLSETEIEELAQKAAKLIPERVRYYAPRVGVTYGRITLRWQKTRWGSCSAAGNLNFNCLLMLAPPEVLDSVVVHELCHRRHMDHSAAFYSDVLRVFPDYYRCRNWLNKHGAALQARLPRG